MLVSGLRGLVDDVVPHDPSRKYLVMIGTFAVFIGTANQLGPIPPPLRDRMEVIELAGYTEEEKLKIATDHLVDKQVKRASAITPDFIGFSCPPVFVVGYGMDLHNRYRELPFIGELTAPG